MKVIVYWKGDTAEAQGPRTRFTNIEWVCERQDQLILACTESPDHPPRYVIDNPDENVAYWHETDPDVTVTLDSNFEDDLREALLDDMERKARDEIAPELEREVTQLLEAYGRRNEYDVRAIVQATRTEVNRSADGVRVVLRMPHPALLFERGTVDHPVPTRNADMLSFVWEERHNPPEWVREEFEREGDGWRVFLPETNVSGLPEGRFIRDALHHIRRELS